MQHKSTAQQEGEEFIVHVSEKVRDKDWAGEDLESFVLVRKSSGELILRLNGSPLRLGQQLELTDLVQKWQKTTGLTVDHLVVLPGTAWMNDSDTLSVAAAKALAEAQRIA